MKRDQCLLESESLQVRPLMAPCPTETAGGSSFQWDGYFDQVKCGVA